jgi:hypothetical protein
MALIKLYSRDSMELFKFSSLDLEGSFKSRFKAISTPLKLTLAPGIISFSVTLPSFFL